MLPQHFTAGLHGGILAYDSTEREGQYDEQPGPPYPKNLVQVSRLEKFRLIIG